MQKEHSKGFTLIEILVVIGLIAVLAAVVIIAVNPVRQFALARNSERQSHINTILNAIGQNMADNQGTFTCPTTLPEATPCNQANAKNIGSGNSETEIGSCIDPTYVSQMPTDPSTGTYTDATHYSSGYSTCVDSTTKRISVFAPNAELGTAISVTR